MKTDKTEAWVVYERRIPGRHIGCMAVCEQAEWDAIQAGSPGVYTLIQGGITNEGVAERIARAHGPSREAA